MRGWDAVQGSRKRGEHTLDCVKHRGSRWRGEFVFKKLPLPLSFFPHLVPLNPLLLFFFLFLLFLHPPPSLPAESSLRRHTLTPFTPRGSIRQQTEDDLRDNSRRALLDPRARDFPILPSPFFRLFFSLSLFFSIFPLLSSPPSFFPSLFSTGSTRGMPRITDKRGMLHGCTRVKHACSTPRNEKARVRGSGRRRGERGKGGV